MKINVEKKDLIRVVKNNENEVTEETKEVIEKAEEIVEEIKEEVSKENSENQKIRSALIIVLMRTFKIIDSVK